MMAPIPAPMAMPKNGTKNNRPNRNPQNMPHVVPAPTACWLVMVRSLPSSPRMMAATASGWMTRSWDSLMASSMAATAVVVSS